MREQREPVPSLTAADVEHYHERGVLRIADAFPREVALEAHEAMWRIAERQGAKRDDPHTWPASFRGFASLKSFVARTQTPRLTAALDQLLGKGRWSYPKAMGGLLISPPDPPGSRWTLTDRPWHWDGTPDIRASVFCMFSDLDPRCGGTLLVEGSGRLLADWYQSRPPGPARTRRNERSQFLAHHPFLRRLSGLDQVAADPDDLLSPYDDAGGRRLCVTEVSGRAGDAVVYHSNLLHATPVHTGTAPRFLSLRSVQPPPGTHPGDV